jgi:hypothetical protein
LIWIDISNRFTAVENLDDDDVDINRGWETISISHSLTKDVQNYQIKTSQTAMLT